MACQFYVTRVASTSSDAAHTVDHSRAGVCSPPMSASRTGRLRDDLATSQRPVPRQASHRTGPAAAIGRRFGRCARSHRAPGDQAARISQLRKSSRTPSQLAQSSISLVGQEADSGTPRRAPRVASGRESLPPSQVHVATPSAFTAMSCQFHFEAGPCRLKLTGSGIRSNSYVLKALTRINRVRIPGRLSGSRKRAVATITDRPS
jgi:hypothetical protein